jgi:hypothetical protein
MMDGWMDGRVDERTDGQIDVSRQVNSFSAIFMTSML